HPILHFPAAARWCLCTDALASSSRLQASGCAEVAHCLLGTESSPGTLNATGQPRRISTKRLAARREGVFREIADRRWRRDESRTHLLLLAAADQLDVAVAVDPRVETRVDDGRSLILGDDCRARDAGAGREVLAAINGEIEEFAGDRVEDRAPVARWRGGG